MRKYDAFISHASEDKDDLVEPLASCLVRLGVKVWYDRFELRLGDSLAESISRGLARSNHGLVVISKNFLAKKWTRHELRGLTTKEVETDGAHAIIPIWHGVTKSEVLAIDPPLADKLALLTSGMTVEQIAIAVTARVRPDLTTKIRRRMQFLVERERETKQVEKCNAEALRLPGPQHRTLSPALEGRIRLIRTALLPAMPDTMGNWIYNFRCDSHPADEIAVWERIASAFLEYCQYARIGRDQLRQVLDVLVALSLGVSRAKLLPLTEGLPSDALSLLAASIKSRVPLIEIRNARPAQLDDECDLSGVRMDREYFPKDIPNDILQSVLKTERRHRASVRRR